MEDLEVYFENTTILYVHGSAAVMKFYDEKYKFSALYMPKFYTIDKLLLFFVMRKFSVKISRVEQRFIGFFIRC
jgi:hypothetical protein